MLSLQVKQSITVTANVTYSTIRDFTIVLLYLNIHSDFIAYDKTTILTWMKFINESQTLLS